MLLILAIIELALVVLVNLDLSGKHTKPLLADY